MVNEFLDRSERAGDIVVRTGPDPYWAEVAYFALRRAVSALLGDSSIPDKNRWTNADTSASRGLDELFAGRVSSNDRRSPAERRSDLGDALRWALKDCRDRNSKKRIIMAIDDLHRVDGSSRTAFADCLGDPPAVEALFIACHTPGLDPGWGAQHATRVIGGLAAPIVTRVLKTSRPSESLQALNDAGTRGVPALYLEQVIRFLQDGGTQPPTRLADLIAQRISTLDPAERKVLQALGVLGDEAEVDSIKRLVGKSLDVSMTLVSLGAAGMIEENGTIVSLSHPLFREIILVATPAEVRRELHAGAVRVYEECEAPIEALAVHAYHAQDSFEALMLLEQVADRAMARGDLPAAVSSLRRGLTTAREEIYRGEIDDPMRAVSIFGRKLGDALTLAGDFSDASGVLREALDMTGPAGVERAHLLGSLAQVAHARLDSEDALKYLDDAIEVAKKCKSGELLANLTTKRVAWTP